MIICETYHHFNNLENFRILKTSTFKHLLYGIGPTMCQLRGLPIKTYLTHFQNEIPHLFFLQK